MANTVASRSPAQNAGTAKNTPHDYLYTEALNEQFWSDPGWNGGEYKSNADVVEGLKRHAHIWAVMGFSTEFWKQEVWRALEFESKEAFIEGFLEPYFTVMDPNDLLCMAWKWQRGDIARHGHGYRLEPGNIPPAVPARQRIAFDRLFAERAQLLCECQCIPLRERCPRYGVGSSAPYQVHTV
jgi:homoserine acetyltransferase